MAHARQAIRQAIATAVTGLTTTGARVYQSRLHALRDANLPCLLVNTDEEEIDSGMGIKTRLLSVKIRAVAKAAADLDDALDTMAAEVETALAPGFTAASKKLFATLTEIQVDMVDELEKPAGVITLSFQVTYATTLGAPTTLI